jgi:MFS transporter, DHA2 family, multidrug resistance protein
MYRALQQQALLWAFIDIFRWAAVITLSAAALSWMFRKVTFSREK